MYMYYTHTHTCAYTYNSSNCTNSSQLFSCGKSLTYAILLYRAMPIMHVFIVCFCQTLTYFILLFIQVVYVWEVIHAAREKSPIQLHLKHTLHGHTGPVICLATSSSYNLIASGSKVSTYTSFLQRMLYDLCNSD